MCASKCVQTSQSSHWRMYALENLFTIRTVSFSFLICRQTINWTNADLLIIGSLTTHFCEIKDSDASRILFTKWRAITLVIQHTPKAYRRYTGQIRSFCIDSGKHKDNQMKISLRRQRTVRLGWLRLQCNIKAVFPDMEISIIKIRG